MGASRAMADLTDLTHLAEMWALLTRLGTDAEEPDRPRTATTSRGVHLAVGPATPGLWHVSVSHPEQDVAALPLALGGRGVMRSALAVHCSVPAGDPPPWLDPGYFDAAGSHCC